MYFLLSEELTLDMTESFKMVIFCISVLLKSSCDCI